MLNTELKLIMIIVKKKLLMVYQLSRLYIFRMYDIPIPYFQSDNKTDKIISVNAAFSKLLEMPTREILMLKDTELYTVKSIKEDMVKILQEKEKFCEFLVNVKTNSGQKWARITAWMNEKYFYGFLSEVNKTELFEECMDQLKKVEQKAKEMTLRYVA